MHVGSRPPLDVDQRLAKAHGDGPRLGVTYGPGAPCRLHGAHRCDDGGGAAREHLGQRAVRAAGPPLLDADASFVDLIAEVLAKRQQRISRDARQQGACELGRDEPRVGP